MADGNGKDWSMYLRLVSQSALDSSSLAPSDVANDAAVLDAVKRLNRLCKEENNEELVARIYPSMNKLFQRCCSASLLFHSTAGLLALAILQFFLDHGDLLLHDSDPSLRAFLRSCLTRQFSDPAVAAATIDFLNQNKTRLLVSYTSVLPQFFPLLLKVIAWGDERLDDSFLLLLPALVAPSSFLPIFPALLDLPILVLALESLEQRSRSVPSSNSATGLKNPEPEALLALMDEAYTGTSIADNGGDFGDEDPKREADALFLDLLKDENEGLAEKHWSHPGMTTALQSAMGSVQSEKLKHALKLAPSLLQVYFDIALRDVNDSLLCALLPIVFIRVDAIFPEKAFTLEIHKKCIEFVLAAFQQSPHFIAVLKKPIMDRIGQPHTSSAKAELASQLCWAVGEHGGGGASQKDAARELFETLELVLYENLSSSQMPRSRDQKMTHEGALAGRSAQARLLCFVVTAIAKLSTCHRELSPRARVCLAKVARSCRFLDKTVWRRAQDYLSLMQEPIICLSILGPSHGDDYCPGTIQWCGGGTKAVANIPFYLLGEQKGLPFHDFSLSDIIGNKK
ncbi:hypothetical protein O6H91_18G066100 [Diphasiastrum complanatum]|uniref:Uncharacterized protein n=2 Tax=Diphasiastrum complanatum TaxID=34168 RepID=A0ACC2B2D5_DIPCM|nr:hypothetical protein O6H91_18G066100 [Diphasiastrum complanatum]KAJ7523877.1 hypothetical protein O6H91_18G066100 [Diphasiastrum complanatum]